MSKYEGLTAMEVAENLHNATVAINPFGLPEVSGSERELLYDAKRGPERRALLAGQVVDHDGKPRWLLTEVSRWGRDITITPKLLGEVTMSLLKP